mmetsp:Transcript_50539/g.156394  ORF Transcript_50539/g.156394 Transcript_50539/m.156394 type:complete len:205 (+) Transcript_50539:1700-2314(+)
MEASASESARPACAARSPPQSLPPSPHMPTTRPRAWKDLTTLILSSGFILAKTTILDQTGSSFSGKECKWRQAACVTASCAAVPPASPQAFGPQGRPSSSSLSGSIHTRPPHFTSSKSTAGRVTIPHCLPILMPVSALSPVQMTDLTEPAFKSAMALGEVCFISLRKSKRPLAARPCSRESRVISPSCSSVVPDGRVFVARASV